METESLDNFLCRFLAVLAQRRGHPSSFKEKRLSILKAQKVQILVTDSCMFTKLRISGGQNDAAFVSRWKKCSIVNLWVVGVVNDEEPMMARVGKPCFHMLKGLSILPTQLTHINESLPCCFFAAGVDPDDAPETVQTPSVSKT